MCIFPHIHLPDFFAIFGKEPWELASGCCLSARLGRNYKAKISENRVLFIYASRNMFISLNNKLIPSRFCAVCAKRRSDRVGQVAWRWYLSEKFASQRRSLILIISQSEILFEKLCEYRVTREFNGIPCSSNKINFPARDNDARYYAVNEESYGVVVRYHWTAKGGREGEKGSERIDGKQ